MDESGERLVPRQAVRRRRDSVRRPHVVQIKLSDAELAEIDALARAMKCSRPRVFTAALASGGAVFGRVELLQSRNLVSGLAASNRMLAGATNNLNQLARAVNSGDALDGPAFAATCAAIRETCAQLNSIIVKAYPES